MATLGLNDTVFQRRTLLGAVAAAALWVSGAPSARAETNLVDLQIVDRETGEPLRVWRRGGRQFIAGEPGRRYSLRLVNQSEGRVLVVLSVDGVNVVTGETAGVRQSGYVLYPAQSADISGWRKSDSEVAAFAFAPLPQSYAARTGRPSDVGVVGMAVFKEKLAPPPVYVPAPAPAPLEGRVGRGVSPRGRPDLPTNIPPLPVPPVQQRIEAPALEGAAAAVASRPQEKLGTAHGAREWSAVKRVQFERAASHPQLIRQIEYDTYANLLALGVIPPAPRAEPRPRPFPSRDGYVPDPPRF
jgi:hypothetical protein